MGESDFEELSQGDSDKEDTCSDDLHGTGSHNSSDDRLELVNGPGESHWQVGMAGDDTTRNDVFHTSWYLEIHILFCGQELSIIILEIEC